MLLLRKYAIIGLILSLSLYSLTARSDTELWSQDFSMDTRGLVELPQSASIISDTLSLSTSESKVSYVEHVYAFEAGVKFSAQLTFLNESEQGNDFFHFGLSNFNLDRSHGLVFHNGKAHAKRVGISGLEWQILGDYQTGVPYQMELITDKNLGTTIRVYELGSDPTTGFVNQMAETDWNQVYALIELGRVDNGAVANVRVDNIVESVPDSLSDGDIELWKQDFTVDGAGLSDLGDYFSISNGKLNVNGPTIASNSPPIYGQRHYPPEANVTFKYELTPTAFASAVYLSTGIKDHQNDISHSAALLDNQWRAITVDGSQYNEVILGNAALNTTYQIEIETSQTESRLYIYEQGQSKAQGLQHTFAQSNWLGIKTYLALHVEAENTSVQATIDNIIELIPSDAIQAPNLTINSPESGSFTNNNNPAISLTYNGDVDIDTDSIEILESGVPLAINCNATQIAAECLPSNIFTDGEINLLATIADTLGNISEPADTTFTVDTASPTITINSPPNNSVTNVATQILELSLNEQASSLVLTHYNDLSQTTDIQSLPIGETTSYSQSIVLGEGLNTLSTSATDLAGNSGSASANITLDTQAPSLPQLTLINISEPENGVVTIIGASGSVEANTLVTVTNTTTNESIVVTANANGEFTLQINAQINQVLNIRSQDGAGNNSPNASATVQVLLPSDPATIAPAINSTEITPFIDRVAFLFSGNNPIQTGVQAGTMNAEHIAVVRGSVFDRNNNPLPGVTVSVLNREEFGQTITRQDGMFDLAVNGGEVVTIQYQQTGYLPVQRKVTLPWRDFVAAEDIVMIPLDSQVTTITANASTMQLARGSVQTDIDGSRQATIIFPQNTTATMTLADGSTQGLSTLDVRATEYTVGENGAQAMPATLPANSAYTYAVELSVDEAITAGAHRVDFNQPLPFYVENFLNFPVGELVPVGYYDARQAQWIPSDNGRIVEVLNIAGGQATLDVIGDGNAATQLELDELNISVTELQQLATLYSAGETLWRVTVNHFTPFDLNWPFRLPSDAEPPPNQSPVNPDGNRAGDSNDENSCPGCTISPQGQTLGESIPITGTPYSLNYSSDRVPGRRAKNVINIQLSEEQIPQSLRAIILQITIAGQSTRREIVPSALSNFSFEWDGLDAYGRQVFGPAIANIEIGYAYPCVYIGGFRDSSGGGGGGGGTRSFGIRGMPDSVIGTRDNCGSLVLLSNWRTPVESPFTPPVNVVGGWSLDVHHHWAASGSRLYKGDGSYRTLNSTINTVAGNGTTNIDGDGGPATEAGLGVSFSGIALDASNNLYIAAGSRIRRVNADDGTISTLVNTSGVSCCFVDMDFDEAGNMYIADSGGYIRRLDVNGTLTTIAGDGSLGFAGDGGPAINARFWVPRGIAVDQAGNIYIADSGNYRIRRISPDGIITTFAGDGSTAIGAGGDGGLATDAQFRRPEDVAVDREGNVYIADSSSNRIRKVDASGMITTVAGNGFARFSGDGGPATAAGLRGPSDITFDNFGNMYIADLFNHRIRRVGSDGVISTVAGLGSIPASTSGGFSGDGGPATAAFMHNPASIAADPAGDLYIVDTNNRRVRRIFGLLNDAFSNGNVDIASEDSLQLHRFDNAGRHLQTFNTLTGSVTHTFGRDSVGRLITVTDGDGNTTTIERNAAGQATAIVSEDGQRTVLALDNNGYLSNVTNPAGEQYQMTYTPLGLMTQFRDRRSQLNSFVYDSLGRLQQDTNAGGGGWTITRNQISDNRYNVNMTTAENRVLTFGSEQFSNGDILQTNTAADGSIQTRRLQMNGEEITTLADGTVITLNEKPDPRFSMQAPVPDEIETRLPSGLTSVTRVQRTSSIENISDLLSLQTQTDTIDINGRIFQRQYDTTTRTYTDTSAEGRITTRTVDSQGRTTSAQITGLNAVDFNYDNRGRLIQISEGSGAAQRDTAFTYYGTNAGSQAGYLQSITDAINRTVSFEYDDSGRVVRQTLPDNREIQYAYDANGNLTSIIPPGRPAHIFNYNAFDLEGNYTPPVIPEIANPATVYNYNLDKQLEFITRPDGEVLDFQYHASTGKLTGLVTSGSRNYSYDYDSGSGKLVTLTSPDNVAISYDYDGSLLTDIDWSGTINGSIDITYNNDFLVNQRCVNGDGCIGFIYDNDNLLTDAGSLIITRDIQRGGIITNTSLGNSNTAITYNDFNELEIVDVNFSTNDLYDAIYTRDNIGRITSKTETVQGSVTTQVYDYDSYGRLISVIRDGNLTTYSYDGNGNRLNRVKSDSIETGSYDNQDRLLSYGDCNYSYTENGELETRVCGAQVTTYNYDAMGNLLRVDLPNGDNIEYIIDGKQRRVGKRLNGTLVRAWLYKDTLNPVAELDADGNVLSRFIYGDKFQVPTHMIRENEVYRIISDHLGSPRIIFDVNTGTVIQRIDYDEFGRVKTDTNPGFQPFGFSGGIYDSDTSLVRFGLRDYSPVLGRWTKTDPILFDSGDTNLYSYVENDPINYYDPVGLLRFSVGGRGSFFFGGAGGTAGANIGIDSSGQVCAQVQTCGRLGAGASVGLSPAVTIGEGTFCEGVNDLSGGAFGTLGFGGVGSISTNTSSKTGNTSVTGTIGVGGGASGGIQACVTRTFCF